MTTVAAIRTTWLNVFLERTDGQTVPWSDGECNQRITDALTQLFQDGIGKFTSGTATPSQASDVYTLPAALQPPGRISRIELEQSSGGVSQKISDVTSWKRYSSTQVRVTPRLPTDASLLLRFFGWAPYATDASDLPTRLENAIGLKAGGLAYTQLASSLVNSQTQQGLDSGRVVDYQTAAGLAAYFERRYQEIVRRDPDRMSFAPRRSGR